MKKAIYVFLSLLIFVLTLFMPGCSTVKPDNDLKKVEQSGELPENLRSVVENNIFHGIKSFDERVLKIKTTVTDKKKHLAVHNIQMMDLYGDIIASYSCESDDAYHIRTLTTTNDGGFLFILGFEDYAYNQNEWASKKGFSSRVIKCDSSGKLQFDTAFNGVEGDAFCYCFEADSKYYLLGTAETPETKTQGVHSPTDVYIAILDSNGNIIKTTAIGGSDYDDLHFAQMTDNSFVLSVTSQSGDGDFSAENADGQPIDYVITVNKDLEITQKEQKTGKNDFSEKIGERNGKDIYNNDELLNDFDAGRPTAFIDYGDFYMIVSENQTGVYEKTPEYISSVWYYTETVYSGYDYNGKLLFRASADSTPDYDSRLEDIT
ncbi:MAG: hypothetical protein IKL09_04505 [Clostridia bacterium]|nr:hypothetical protein [Clostridia bacterium]